MPTDNGSLTGSERVRDYKNRQRKRGLKLVKVWVPEKDVRRLQEVAKKMRSRSRICLPEDNAPSFPGWAYLRVARHEREIHDKLRRHGGRWMKDKMAWRIRADRVDEVGMRERIIPDAKK